MKNKTKISLKIIAIFCTAILASFIPDNFHSFFGDWFCDGLLKEYDKNYNVISRVGNCAYGDGSSHNPSWHWGWRHWLWMFMGLSLFIVQCIDLFSNEENK